MKNIAGGNTHTNLNEESEWLHVSDLPKVEQESFSRWLRGGEIYSPKLYEAWKTAPEKVARECGKGWYPLIDACEKELAALGFNTDHLLDDVAVQAHKIARKYERQAYSICEKCGSDQGIPMLTEDTKATIFQECNIKLYHGEFRPAEHY